MIKGKCNCGSVSFEVLSRVEDVYICHCSICRRSTGGPGVAIVIVENESFNWLSGKELVRVWDKPNHDWQANFCTICGSAVPGKNSEHNLYVPVSLLCSDTEKLKVAHHIFVGSKASWEEIGDEGKQHIGAYGE